MEASNECTWWRSLWGEIFPLRGTVLFSPSDLRVVLWCQTRIVNRCHWIFFFLFFKNSRTYTNTAHSCTEESTEEAAGGDKPALLYEWFTTWQEAQAANFPTSAKLFWRLTKSYICKCHVHFQFPHFFQQLVTLVCFLLPWQWYIGKEVGYLTSSILYTDKIISTSVE